MIDIDEARIPKDVVFTAMPAMPKSPSTVAIIAGTVLVMIALALPILFIAAHTGIAQARAAIGTATPYPTVQSVGLYVNTLTTGHATAQEYPSTSPAGQRTDFVNVTYTLDAGSALYIESQMQAKCQLVQNGIWNIWNGHPTLVTVRFWVAGVPSGSWGGSCTLATPGANVLTEAHEWDSVTAVWDIALGPPAPLYVQAGA